MKRLLVEHLPLSVLIGIIGWRQLAVRSVCFSGWVVYWCGPSFWFCLLLVAAQGESGLVFYSFRCIFRHKRENICPSSFLGVNIDFSNGTRFFYTKLDFSIHNWSGPHHTFASRYASLQSAGFRIQFDFSCFQCLWTAGFLWVYAIMRGFENSPRIYSGVFEPTIPSNRFIGFRLCCVEIKTLKKVFCYFVSCISPESIMEIFSWDDSLYVA